jgi:hypothetical protein
MDYRALKARQCLVLFTPTALDQHANLAHISMSLNFLQRCCGPSSVAGRTHRHRCARLGARRSDQRGPDRRRPKHVAAGGKLLVPALDDALCLGARGDVGNLPLGSHGNIEAPRPHAHWGIIGRIAEQSKAPIVLLPRLSYHRPVRAPHSPGYRGSSP